MNRSLPRPGTLGALLTLIALSLLPAAGRTAPTEQVLYSFSGGTDGGGPNGSLIFDASGAAFGTTHFGGITTCGGQVGGGCGVVFKLMRSKGGWAESPLFAFADGADGGFPNAGLILDKASNVYGTASTGGSTQCSIGCGVVFELLRSGHWKESVLHTFTGSDGQFPNANLLAGAGGVLYSTTWFGGTTGNGTVFSLKRGAGGIWTESVLYDFMGQSDGSAPAAGVIQNGAGALFGTTYKFDGSNDGVAYELVPQPHAPWKQLVLNTFGNGAGGSDPYAGLISDGAGNLYGTTIEGGSNGSGVVFQLVRSGKSWKENILHTFGTAGDGAMPYGGLVMDKAGTLFGTTVFGGAANSGVVYELRHTGGNWKESVLFAFTGGADGGYPGGTLTLDAAGDLYGAASNGGTYGRGVIFEIVR